MSPKPPHVTDPAWLKEIESIRPLGAKAPPQPPTPKMPPPTNPDIFTLPPKPRPVIGWNEAPAFPVLSNTAECISGHAPHMEPGLFKQLAQGKLRPTALLDLHGLGEGDAWLELVDFLHKCVETDHRTALIIHGKGTGYGPQKNMGVIKFQIGTWLASHPKVLAFHTTIQADGGTGAVYIYLKRHGR
jgi:DNA-nicking Smr family endonuclease